MINQNRYHRNSAKAINTVEPFYLFFGRIIHMQEWVDNKTKASQVFLKKCLGEI